MEYLHLLGLAFLVGLGWRTGLVLVDTVVMTINAFQTRRAARKYMAKLAEQRAAAEEGDPAQAEANQGRHGHYA